MRETIRRFLKIDAAENMQITISQKLDYYANAAKNKLWYRGKSEELSQLYEQLDVPSTVFWKASSTKGMEIRKIHVGLPKLLVNTLRNIVCHDFNGVDIDNREASEKWDEISKFNEFDKILKKAVKGFLITGDGAFKLSFDKEISEKYPIIEYFSGENVEFIYKRGRISEIVFLTQYINDKKEYAFKERYGYGSIKYELYNSSGTPVPVNSIPQTSWIDSEGVKFDKDIMLAVPVIFGESEEFEGRGESIFEGKDDNFDALDECVSQWMDALRAGRTKEYIPENLIPRDPNTGKVLEPNAFDNRYITTGNDVSESGNGNRIYNEQSAIPHDSYLATYITLLDLCLQGIMSPSTLGIDTKKLDNSEAQREKEKTTLYTRDNIIDLLSEVVPKLVTAAIGGFTLWNKTDKLDLKEVKTKFGEYANPSFESQVETVTKARGGVAIMSIEAGVDELYGSDKDKTWKEDEVKRLKAEQGIVELDEPKVSAAAGAPIISDNG